MKPAGAAPIASDAVENLTELRVVHALRLKSFADADVIAQSAGIDVARVQSTLDGLAEVERVKYRDGRVAGWMLTPCGRSHGEALLAAQLDGASKRSELDALYRRFLEHNQPFLNLCTDWQVRMIGGVQTVNDHCDTDYDAAIIARLVDIHTEMQPICVELGALFERFAHYAPSFASAVANVQLGGTDWFTKLMIDSYHTVWFELHEDLLASLGIDRVKEGHA